MCSPRSKYASGSMRSSAPRSVREVSIPPPHSVVAVVDGAAGNRHRRMELDLRIAERDECLYVAGVERLHGAAMAIHVLLRYRLRQTHRVEGFLVVPEELHVDDLALALRRDGRQLQRSGSGP